MPMTRRLDALRPSYRRGTALFDAAFQNPAAQRLFGLFLDTTDQNRLLTISAKHPAILSLPWELLRGPKGIYLFNENPRISIRRRLAEAPKRNMFAPKVKQRLRLLFVTSRPSDAGFIDPRSESQAVMNSVERHAPGRVNFEFLRPATFRNLAERLAGKSLPTIDVIHFDGHGAFDTKGSFGDGTPNTGYLLFERDSGLKQFISPNFWQQMIGDYKVPLVILSACQSAAMSDSDEGDEAEEPIGSVAYGLTGLGVPAVLAMTHSLLVETAGQLFGEFYRHLAESKGIGESLDNARHHLMQNPEKHEVQRGAEPVRLTLQDWFLPAFYQAGQDVPLLDASVGAAAIACVDVDGEDTQSTSLAEGISLTANLPKLQKAGFFGRQRELWDIERWFTQGTRCISIIGFGGQGKTYLVAEAGRWLRRTGMFERVGFVDYSAFQGIDACGYAVATLGTVLGESFLNVNDVAAALRQRPMLVILDNLEDLVKNPLVELLSAAKTWSECGNSRLLLTSRTSDFHHTDYPFAGSIKHRVLKLAGLGQEDALNYFESLMRIPPLPEQKVLPPARDALLELFRLVSFHPLSIHLLAVQLKTLQVTELGARLESLLAEGGDDKNKSLSASLRLSLDRLDAQSWQWLPRLGVFQGGALEKMLLSITEIPEVRWLAIREQLQALALIEVESLEGVSDLGGALKIHLPLTSVFEGVSVSYIKFHPTLASRLWSNLPQLEKDSMATAHSSQYIDLFICLKTEDEAHPREVRAIACRELPNLLDAIKGWRDKTSDIVDLRLAQILALFLRDLGLKRDSEALIKQAAPDGKVTNAVQGLRAEGKEYSEVYVQQAIMSGEQLLATGRAKEAEAIFRELLPGVGDSLRCYVLNFMGLSLAGQGRPDLAEKSYHEALDLVEKLGINPLLTGLRAEMQKNLGCALGAMGRYAEARTALEVSLATAKELGKSREIAITNGHLGTLAMEQGDLPGAARRYKEALSYFHGLNELASETFYWHQLGMVFQKSGQLDEAEKAYRESTRIAESQGNLFGAANSWHSLAQLNKNAGKYPAAEDWYQKAMQAQRRIGDQVGLSWTLMNLADLLQNQSGRLAEAQQLAEESLAIKKTLQPGEAKIWLIYDLLAQIADKQNNLARAQEYRRQEHAAWRTQRTQVQLASGMRLADAAPEKAAYARDLSISFEKLGDQQMARGNAQMALGYYQLSLDLRQRLADAAPENADYTRDLGVSFERLGNLQVALGNAQIALDYYQRSHDIFQRLADAAPEHADYACDLAVSYYGMARSTEGETLKAWWRRCYEQFASMKQRGILAMTDE
jgi:tetratricopeptide (TPR) repeat protein